MKSVARVLLGLACSHAAAAAAAETKSPPTPADFGQWETLAPPASRGGLSPDGRYLAYGVNRSNRNNELRVTSVADGTTKVAAFGSQPAFSADSRFVAYAIGVSEAQEEKLRKDKKTVKRKLGLLTLASGETVTFDEIESFAFDASGAHLAMRRYAPDKPDKKDADSGAPAEAEPTGATLVVRALATGRDTTFGNVAEFAWQDKGKLLAFTIATEDKTGNGVQLFDPETGALRTLDSSASSYSGLSWRKEKDDLALLRSKSDERREGATQAVLAFRHLAGSNPDAKTYDPTSDAGFTAGMRTVAFRKPSWSDDGAVVFVGTAKWNEAAASAKKPAAPTPAAGADAAAVPALDDDEPATVDVWHARDVDVQPKQKVQAKADRERNLLCAWHVESGRLVPLAKASTEQVAPVRHQPLAYAEDWTPYAMDRSIGRPAADLYLIDLATGARAKVRERVIDAYAQTSPGGRYVLFLQDDHYFTVDTATRAIVDITKNVPTSFVDKESDQTVKQKPPFGVAGWLKDDKAVILYDKFDLWRIAPDGSGAQKLTDGAAEQVRHRYVRVDPDAESIDPAQPLYVSLFGLWTKRSGYGRIQPGATGAERLVWLDKLALRLGKAKDADTYGYVLESFDDSPDIFVGGGDLKAKQVTKTNPFQERFAWGRAELVEYKSERGERLQGALFHPAGYEAGKRYPMVVYLYEKRSDQLHQYSSPSERDSYNMSAFTSAGYFVLQPDIVFRPREPGLSVAECVTPAVRRVVQMGVVDARRVGVVGHSWGGFDASFLATHTDVFAAAVAGAPITDLVSNYGNHHWGPGIAETDHIETGQQRMEVPLWEDLQAYIRNSALFNAQNMTTPLLIEVGDADGTVFWHQGIELYNVARRARKQVVLLAYAGEDHGLRKKPNQLDYHRRIVEWFGHYLKGEPAAPWITSGMSYLAREQELRQAKAKKGHAPTD